MSIPNPRVVGIIVALSAMGGCTSVQKELEHVAKDWCMTIRASQVIPVYPLTEDLQPGDVFLVTVPIQKQADIYKRKGFLPLDLTVTRLHELDYEGYYAPGYWTGDFAPTEPHPRMVGQPGPATTAGDTSPSDGGELTRGLGAPRAAFPTYTFKVSKGSAARLAIPVQGVPVALGFMGSSNAVGSVTISDAYTYAAPTEDLVKKLHAWAGKTENRAMLAQLVAENQQTLYLRVVQRVYMTGGVVVSVMNEGASGAGGSGDLSPLAVSAPRGASDGGPPPLADGGEVEAAKTGAGAGDAPGVNEPPPTATVNGSTGTWERRPSGGVPGGTSLGAVSDELSAALSDKTPGASLRILQASSRAVSMKENFDRPLVIGYIGFDFPIRAGGELGVPIATLNQLERRGAPPSTAGGGATGLTASEQEFRYRMLAFAAEDPVDQMTIVESVAGQLEGVEAYGEPVFAGLADRASVASTPDLRRAVADDFVMAANNYVSLDGGNGPRAARISQLIDWALAELGQ